MKRNTFAVLFLGFMTMLSASAWASMPKDKIERAEKSEISEHKFLNKNQATAIAYNHAGVSADSVTYCKVEMEQKKSGLIYEIEFIAGSADYEYEIDAATGNIIEGECEEAQSHNDASKGFIGTEKAKEIAFSTKGIKPSEVSVVDVELGREDGMIIYEVEFHHNGKKYEVEIDAISGAIVD